MNYIGKKGNGVWSTLGENCKVYSERDEMGRETFAETITSDNATVAHTFVFSREFDDEWDTEIPAVVYEWENGVLIYERHYEKVVFDKYGNGHFRKTSNPARKQTTETA